jgi:hypothetical protein
LCSWCTMWWIYCLFRGQLIDYLQPFIILLEILTANPILCLFYCWINKIKW